MNLSPISRRMFLGALGALGLSTLPGCGGGTGPGGAVVDTNTAFRLSTRGKRASRASKANAANKLFSSEAAALLGRAHPGDPATVVRVNVSTAFWTQHFGAGEAAVDLRHL